MFATLSSRFEAWLARLPLVPLVAGLWLGCGWPPAEPSFLLLPALTAFARRGRARLFGQACLGLWLGARLLAAVPSPDCPLTGERASHPAGWLARVIEIAAAREARTSLTVDLLIARDSGAPLRRCRVQVSAGRRPPEVLEGDVVWLPALELEPPAHLVNPELGDSAEALTARGIDRVGTVPDGTAILTLQRAAIPWRLFARLRAHAAQALSALPPGDGRELARALALGHRSTIDPVLLDAFRDTGVQHLLTLGLFYLSIWLAILGALLSLGWGWVEPLALWVPARRATAILLLPIPLLYGVLGDGAASRRALGVGAGLLLANALGRGRGSSLHLFSLAAAGLLAAAPEESRRPGLAWAAAAVGGIALLSALWRARTGGDAGVRGWRGRIEREAARTLTVGVAAFLATAPLQLAETHALSLATVPLGVVGLAVALPAALLAQIGALLSSPSLLRLALAPAEALGLLVRAAATHGRGLLLLAPTLTRLGLPLGEPPLRITFLSIGQGDCTLIETPHGRAILIDGGGSVVGAFDPGRQIVVPYLRARGLRTLDVVILSHPHPDHANGLPAVLRAVRVAEVWQSGEPCPLPACDEIDRLSAEQGTQRLRLGTGPFERTIDGVTLTLLSPQLPLGYDPALGPNDNSLVLALRYDRFRALLTGDIERIAEARLVAAPLDLRAFLLKAPHHGSDTSSTAPFLAKVRPQAVVFSVGPGNRFDFPRASVVARYRALGTGIFQTDVDGAIRVETDGARVRVTPTRPGTNPLQADLSP